MGFAQDMAVVHGLGTGTRPVEAPAGVGYFIVLVSKATFLSPLVLHLASSIASQAVDAFRIVMKERASFLRREVFCRAAFASRPCLLRDVTSDAASDMR